MNTFSETPRALPDGRHGIEADATAIGEWRPTPSQVRDVILDFLVTGPDFSESLPLEPLAKEFAPTQREVEVTSELCHEAVTAGRMIDFGDLPNDALKLGGSRGGPLFNQSALGQPFQDPWVLYHTWEKAVAIYLVNPMANGDAEVCELQPVLLGGRRILMIADRGIFCRPQPGDAMPTHKYKAIVAPSMLRFLLEPYGAEFNNGGSPESAAAGNIGDPLMTALLILNTRGVDRETIACPPKLAKARLKSGKRPIPPFDRVNTQPYVTALLARRSSGGEDRGGHHASPTPHIRRGHPRVYATGRSIFIRDTLVGVPDDQRASFKSQRSHYTTKGTE
jgi:hypothetical protein